MTWIVFLVGQACKVKVGDNIKISFSSVKYYIRETIKSCTFDLRTFLWMVLFCGWRKFPSFILHIWLLSIWANSDQKHQAKCRWCTEQSSDSLENELHKLNITMWSQSLRIWTVWRMVIHCQNKWQGALGAKSCPVCLKCSITEKHLWHQRQWIMLTVPNVSIFHLRE